jgi:hypothetical protein
LRYRPIDQIDLSLQGVMQSPTHAWVEIEVDRMKCVALGSRELYEAVRLEQHLIIDPTHASALQAQGLDCRIWIKQHA